MCYLFRRMWISSVHVFWLHNQVSQLLFPSKCQHQQKCVLLIATRLHASAISIHIHIRIYHCVHVGVCVAQCVHRCCCTHSAMLLHSKWKHSVYLWNAHIATRLNSFLDSSQCVTHGVEGIGRVCVGERERDSETKRARIH